MRVDLKSLPLLSEDELPVGDTVDGSGLGRSGIRPCGFWPFGPVDTAVRVGERTPLRILLQPISLTTAPLAEARICVGIECSESGV